MHTRTLGPGGLEVSALGLGCMGMSQGYGATDDAESMATLHAALDAGITLLDTAQSYGSGANERLLAPVLSARRDEIVLATKFGIVRDADGVHVDARPDRVRDYLESSLQRLGVDHVDLYYLHRVDPDVPIEESIGAMAQLVAAGKVGHLGVSEVTAEQLERAVAVHPIAAVQTEWSLTWRDVEDEVRPAARRLGVAIVPYSPLGRGLLTGALPAAETFGDGDMRRSDPRFAGAAYERNLALVDAVAEIAAQHAATPAQLALAWLLHQGDDVVPIPGTKRRSRAGRERRRGGPAAERRRPTAPRGGGAARRVGRRSRVVCRAGHRARASDVILTEHIALDGGMGAFVARKSSRPPAAPRAGVVVCHELFGVTMHIREVCERIAALGYVALAPDLYHRISPGAELAHDDAGRERGFELLRELERDEAVADVRAAVDHLRAGGARSVALLGLSLGGHVAYLAATAIDVAAVVCAYPGWLAGTEIGLSRPEPTLTLTAGHHRSGTDPDWIRRPRGARRRSCGDRGGAAAGGRRSRDRRLPADPARLPVRSSRHLRLGRGRRRMGAHGAPARGRVGRHLGPVLRVGVVEARAGVPRRALVAVNREAAAVLEHASDVQEVPGQERRVAVGEVVVEPAARVVEVARAGAASPSHAESACGGIVYPRC